MPVRTRRMKSFGKGVRLPEGSFSSDENIEMCPLAKSMVDELKSYILLQILMTKGWNPSKSWKNVLKNCNTLLSIS